MLRRTSCEASVFTKQAAVKVLPWSEFAMDGTQWRSTAASKTAVAGAGSGVSDSPHPTIVRVARSMTAVRHMWALPILVYVMSVAQAWLGSHILMPHSG